jgi:Flp pilus assembly pilin Flp
MKHTIRKDKKGQIGASLTEYTLLVALIAIVGIGAVRGVGNSINASLTNTNVSLTAATGNFAPCVPPLCWP